MSHLRDLDINEMVELLKTGKTSAEEIAQSCLEAVDLYNEKLNAFIEFRMLDIAAALSERIGFRKRVPEQVNCFPRA
jgi:Asp-tRNA(Asn)/Glu-tRNA(Gln) amidotransferase A subunit family amidase